MPLTAGSGSLSLPIPATPSLAGTGFYLQGVTLDPSNNIVLSNQTISLMGL